jgi:rhamnosyltransferase subunit B
VRPDLDPDDRDLIRRVMQPSGTAVILKELIVPFVRESYGDLQAAASGADLLVTHPVTFAGPLVAEADGLRWVSTVLAPMSFFSRDDPPSLPGMEWAYGSRLLRSWAGRVLVRLAKRITSPWMQPVRQLRRELGLPSSGDPLYEGQFSPHGTLALFSKALAVPQPDWPRNVSVTGFVPYTGPDSMPTPLQDFLGRGEPPIVFTLGSSAVGAAGAFFDESLAAAAAIGSRAVLLVGRHGPPIASGPRAIVVDYAPHDELFARSSAVVHHGGIGTTGQALRSGRPMLVVPFAHDQPDNAARVERLGLARVIPHRRYRAGRVARALRSLLTHGSYAGRAEQVAAEVHAERGAQTAADALERLLRASESTVGPVPAM